jgi:polyisoprenoid-binding protein YceI
MKTALVTLALATASLLTLSPATLAGPTTVVTFGADSKLWIEGDSTLHRYHSTARSWQLNATMAPDQSGFTRLEAVVPVKELKSGDGGLDKNMYATLKADQFPSIRFTLSRGKLKGAGPNVQADAEGRLTIAGVDRPVTLHAEGTLTGTTLHLTGVKELKMSEFGITPPVMMMGAITCSDAIEVHYDLVGQVK